MLGLVNAFAHINMIIPDQAATVLYVDTNTDPGSRILNQLAGNLIEAPFYTHLRTEKQLGYITFATAFPLYNTPILNGAIQSPTANPDELASAIQSEFEGFVATVELMPDEQFESQRLSLLDQPNHRRNRRDLSFCPLNGITQAVDCPTNSRIVAIVLFDEALNLFAD